LPDRLRFSYVGDLEFANALVQELEAAGLRVKCEPPLVKWDPDGPVETVEFALEVEGDSELIRGVVEALMARLPDKAKVEPVPT